MMDVHVTNVFTVAKLDGTPLPAEELHAIGDRLMEELLRLEEINDRVRDSSTSTDADLNELEMDMVVTAESRGHALDLALTMCRTAAHADGAHTPNWPMVGSVQDEPLSFVLATSQASV